VIRWKQKAPGAFFVHFDDFMGGKAGNDLA